MTADELVRKAGIRAHPVALHRALRACAALGIVTEDSVGRFGPTRLSALLTRDTPGTLKRFVEYSGGTLWKIWTGLPEGLATGASQARAQLGLDFFDYLACECESARGVRRDVESAQRGYEHGRDGALRLCRHPHARRRRRRYGPPRYRGAREISRKFAAWCSTCRRSSKRRRRSYPSRTKRRAAAQLRGRRHVPRSSAGRRLRAEVDPAQLGRRGVRDDTRERLRAFGARAAASSASTP